MKRPSICTIFIPVLGLLVAFAPNALSAFVMLAMIIFGSCVLERCCGGAREWFKTAFKMAIHRQYIKPPANLFVLGVVLSVVFVAIGFAWDAHSLSVPMVPGRLFISLLSITAQFLCLGSFVGFLSLLQYAPNFRGSRG